MRAVTTAMWPRLAIGGVAAGLLLTASPGAAFASSPQAAAPSPGCAASADAEFDTPWFDTDATDLEVCISENFPTGEYRAVINGVYGDGGDGSRKFDRFDLTVRIEQGGDIQVAAHTCSHTQEINATSSGSLQCVVEGVPVGGGPITADGFLTYDIEGDGRGADTLSLRGSPAA